MTSLRGSCSERCHGSEADVSCDGVSFVEDARRHGAGLWCALVDDVRMRAGDAPFRGLVSPS